MSTIDAERPRLNRERIAAAALVIADREGFAAVSMRRLARALNVGTMSLYYYVKTKDDLIAAMDDALMREILLSSVPKSWRSAMMQIAKKTHDMYVRHSWSAAAMISIPPGVNAMRHMEQCLEALSETAMTPHEKVTLLTTIDDFVVGHALRVSAVEAVIDHKFVDKQIATGAFPRLSEAFVDASAKPYEHRFECAVNALLDAAEQSASKHTSGMVLGHAAAGRSDSGRQIGRNMD